MYLCLLRSLSIIQDAYLQQFTFHILRIFLDKGWLSLSQFDFNFTDIKQSLILFSEKTLYDFRHCTQNAQKLWGIAWKIVPILNLHDLLIFCNLPKIPQPLT